MTCGYTPILLSAEILLWTLLLQAVLGTGIGWLLARKQFWGKGFLDGIVTMPLIFPPIVIGYALLMALGRNGWLSSLVPELVRPNIIFTTTGLTIAAFVAGLPLR